MDKKRFTLTDFLDSVCILIHLDPTQLTVTFSPLTLSQGYSSVWKVTAQGQGFEIVSPEEAARFGACGFAAVKSEADKLAGMEFFKQINGNGQVF